MISLIFSPITSPVFIFGFVLFIVLVAPLIMNMIKVPVIVGMIIAGTIVGPHGLNLLAKNAAIDLFSTIGLLYIMFIAGIDLDMTEFKKQKHKSLTFGAFTFFIPIVLGFPVCYYLLNLSLIASFLVSSMFATHTLIAYPIVNRYKIVQNEAVNVAVGGTILTDSAVLIILAIIIGAKNSVLNVYFAMHLILSILVFAIIVFVIIPKISKWILLKLKNEQTVQFVFVLFVVFSCASLAQLSGLEPIIGAFAAGLTLNRLILPIAGLKHKVEFVGNAIFIPVFLISVGMLVDLRVIFSGTTALLVAGCLTLTAIVGKWIAAYFTQVVFKYSVVQQKLIFGLTSAHAAATSAIILIGYEAKIIDVNILNGTIILIMVTCIVASFAAEKSCKSILGTNAKKEVFKHIVPERTAESFLDN